MLKKIVIAGAMTATLLGSAALPAYAKFSHADCAYAQKLMDSGATQSGYNEWAATVTACEQQGIK